MIAMKALLAKDEIEAGAEAPRMLGAEISQMIEVEFLPENPTKKRVLVIITKVSSTPDEYPRQTGLPKKRPLGSK